MAKIKQLPLPKLNWVQSDFMEHIPIYFVEVPGYEKANAICIRIEYLYEDKTWIIDLCQTVRIKGDFTIKQVRETKIYAEQQLKKYIDTVKKLYNPIIKP